MSKVEISRPTGSDGKGILGSDNITSIMSKGIIRRPAGTDGKAILGSDDFSAVNNLEKVAMKDLDEDKINEIAKCLFVLNNRKYGPIPGAYMVMCTKPGKEWCVGQLSADRAKPFVLFEDKVFSSSAEAQKEAERIKKERGESAPRRCT